jgi:flagellar hook assembly protein FlgD
LEDWHFQLLDDFDGKSLERIDPFGQSNDLKNWHTAAEAVSFATPGSQNSQYSVGQESGKITLTSDTFSPDNDGIEDIMQFNYEMEEAGMIGTIRIFDDRGRLIKDLVKSELLATKGSFNWDGITEKNQKASIGTYIVFFETFNSEGMVFISRKSFVLAGKL